MKLLLVIIIIIININTIKIILLSNILIVNVWEGPCSIRDTYNPNLFSRIREQYWDDII